MKKLILSLLACGSLAMANAQQAGSIFLFGNAGYSFTNTTANGASVSKVHNFTASPGIGYQFNDNWAIGVNLGYGHNTSGTGGTEDLKTDTYFGGLFGRYTMYHGNRFFCYTQLNANYQHEQDKTDVNTPTETKINSNGFNTSLFPAVGIHITQCLAATANIGGVEYSYLKDNSVDYKTTSFAATIGKQFNLGVQWNFGGSGMHHMHHHRHEPLDDNGDMDNDGTPPPPPPAQ